MAYTINKTDGTVVTTITDGTARVAGMAECTAFNTLGRLLQAKYAQQTELHECVIGVK
jgi:hypothetical protein